MPAPPRVRVVVQLPGNRPDQPLPNPPHIDWTTDKATVLWEVIALSRTSDNGGTDWKGLAAHLDVPLPYLLYRAQARYEEDLRGLKDIVAVAPSSSIQHPSSGEALPTASAEGSADATTPPPLSVRIPLKTHGGGLLSSRALSASARLATPLGVRVRLNSLSHKSPSKLPPPSSSSSGHTQTQTLDKVSSSTATVQGVHLRRPGVSLRPSSPVSEDESSESSDASEVMRRKEEEEERTVEERETLEKKLAQLQRTMTSEMVGLVPNPALAAAKGKEKQVVRGRAPFPMSVVSRATAGVSGITVTGSPATRVATTEAEGHEETGFAARTRNHSASVSSASSPRGSVPSIPTPPSPTSPKFIPRVAPMSLANGNIGVRSSSTTSMRHRQGRHGVSEGGSVQDSSASSFSDLSDVSFSASALESALMSNIPPGSTVARSRLSGRGMRQ